MKLNNEVEKNIKNNEEDDDKKGRQKIEEAWLVIAHTRKIVQNNKNSIKREKDYLIIVKNQIQN